MKRQEGLPDLGVAPRRISPRAKRRWSLDRLGGSNTRSTPSWPLGVLLGSQSIIFSLWPASSKLISLHRQPWGPTGTECEQGSREPGQQNGAWWVAGQPH